jgi:hypothetical protein
VFKSISKNVFCRALGIVILIITCAGAFSRALSQQPKRLEAPFAHGEELVYQAEFNRGLLRGIDVGELRFSARPPAAASNGDGSGNSRTLQLVGDATAKGFLPRLFGAQFHLHVESVLDSESLAVLHTKKVEENRKQVWLSEAVFDHAKRKVTWTEHNPNKSQAASVTTVDFTEPIQDVLTVIYYLRTQRLQPGQSFDVPLSDIGRVYRCSVAVVERRKIKSALGRVDALRVEPAIFGDNRVVRSRGTLSIWITDDARHIPVKAQLKVPAGTFDIKLKRVRYSETPRSR